MTTDAGTPTPDSMPLRKAMERAFNLGQTYWQQADSEFTSQHRKADVTMQTFRDLAAATCAQHDGSITAAEAELGALRARVAGLERALQTVAGWELPPTGKFCPSGDPTSYEADYGSNGARDYIQNVAARALLAPSSEVKP